MHICFQFFLQCNFIMIFAVFCCRNWNNVYFVGIYLFSIPKHTLLVTAITLQFCVYQQHHLQTPNYHYPNTANTERQSNIGGQLILAKLDIYYDVNWPSSGKLRQYTTVPSHCEKLTYPWTWNFLYFNCWSHFEKRPGVV